MNVEKSNVNFGIAMQPTPAQMPHFKKFLAKKTGKIDSLALGQFYRKQEENNKVFLRFRHHTTSPGDVIEVIPKYKSKMMIIPCDGSKVYYTEKQSLLSKIKDYLIDLKNYIVNIRKITKENKSFQYENVGLENNLPDELVRAGKEAEEMGKNIYF